ncbi:cupredoxin domain-containing protein [Rhodothermus profundi]|uniref:Cupredoxin-like domain-containing protein n=1 Tax=Rhodothermus profundi TaxID=633813 RepID=A0A1M6P9J3_9BACT|nr:cupredoxin domain-containing protein [Rhodothermus profundi]SHK04552.1 Cupredoxin-like domain-containing protein [Rhodothermus profundi]
MLALLLVGLGGMLTLALLLGPWPGRRMRLHPGPDGFQEAHIQVGPDGFRPRRIQALAHHPLRLVFHRDPDAPLCARRLHLLSWGRKVLLEETSATRIELPPTAAGTYTFSCMRGRLKGTIQLIEQGANA